MAAGARFSIHQHGLATREAEMAQEQTPPRQIPLFEWRTQWYESFATAPWRIWCSNTPPDEEAAYLDGQADSGHPDLSSPLKKCCS